MTDRFDPEKCGAHSAKLDAHEKALEKGAEQFDEIIDKLGSIAVDNTVMRNDLTKLNNVKQERKIEAEERKKERNKDRRLRWGMIGTVVAALIMAAGGIAVAAIEKG